MMREPQEIEDEEHEQVLERVLRDRCGQGVGDGVHPGAARCRGRAAADPGVGRWTPRRTRSWSWPGTWRRERIEKVTLEATCDYWRIWFYLLEAAGLDVQLVNARDVKNAPGRPKTDKLDAVWLAKLTERGMLRPSFVPPAEIRQLRDYTRLRTDLTRERTRYWQRLEKLLEDSLIKVSSVASTLGTLSARDMIEALIAGERDPKVLAGLARGRMRAKHAALVEALTGQFDDHHAELARMLLDQIDALTAQIGKLTARIGELIAAIPAAQGIDADGTTGPHAGAGPDAPALPALDRLDEIPGISRTRRSGHHRRDRPGHDQVPHRRPPGVVGEAEPAHHPVRAKEPRRADRQGQPLPQRHPRRGRRRGRPHRHLPRRTLPADRQTPRQAQSPGRRRPHHPGDHLAPAGRPRPPATANSAPATTPAAPTKTRRPATTSASSKPSGSPSPSPPPPDIYRTRKP